MDRFEVLRLIYQGRFLHGNVTLGALRLQQGQLIVFVRGIQASFSFVCRQNNCDASRPTWKSPRADQWRSKTQTQTRCPSRNARRCNTAHRITHCSSQFHHNRLLWCLFNILKCGRSIEFHPNHCSIFSFVPLNLSTIWLPVHIVNCKEYLEEKERPSVVMFVCLLVSLLPVAFSCSSWLLTYCMNWFDCFLSTCCLLFDKYLQSFFALCTHFLSSMLFLGIHKSNLHTRTCSSSYFILSSVLLMIREYGRRSRMPWFRYECQEQKSVK